MDVTGLLLMTWMHHSDDILSYHLISPRRLEKGVRVPPFLFPCRTSS